MQQLDNNTERLQIILILVRIVDDNAYHPGPEQAIPAP